jgi:hypothetical protein
VRSGGDGNSGAVCSGAAAARLPSVLLFLLGMALLIGSGVRAESRPLLAPTYGELCTTCEAFLLCEQTPVGTDAGGHTADRVYHVQAHTFWGQIGTIWGWLKHLFAPVRPDTRFLRVYAPADAGVEQGEHSLSGSHERAWRHMADGRVTLDLRSNRIELPDGWIDRLDGAWYDADDRQLGTCGVVNGVPMQMLRSTGENRR